jgi:ribosomal protein S7
MKKRFRDLTEKYKLFRLQPDAVYLSRPIQTLFNKFTKKGKKALARRHIHLALQNFRYSYRRASFHLIRRILRNLRRPLALVSCRKGRTVVNVPVPVRRNKRDVENLQVLYKAIRIRRERDFAERIEQELISLTTKHAQSPTLRARSASLRAVYDERVNEDLR